MRQMTIRSKQTLRKQSYADKNTSDEGENRYAVNCTEDTAKAAARMGKAYAVRQMKKKVQQKRFEKESIPSDPIKACLFAPGSAWSGKTDSERNGVTGGAKRSGDIFSPSGASSSDKEFGEERQPAVKTKEFQQSYALKVRAGRSDLRPNAAVSGAKTGKQRAMRRWNRNNLLQKNSDVQYGSGLHMPVFLSPTKTGVF